MNKEKELKKYINVYNYYCYFYNTMGDSEKIGFLPFLIIWFRYQFEKAEISDYEVCKICEFTKDEEEDFLSWGHNSRYAHTYRRWCLNNKEKVIDLILDLIKRNNGYDPEIIIKE